MPGKPFYWTPGNHEGVPVEFLQQNIAKFPLAISDQPICAALCQSERVASPMGVQGVVGGGGWIFAEQFIHKCHLVSFMVQKRKFINFVEIS